VFTRPIEGTTKIKSFTFVQVEAGKGSTEYPNEAYKNGKKRDEDPHYPLLDNSIKITAATISSRFKAIADQYFEVMRALVEFNEISKDEEGAANKNHDVITLKKIKDAVDSDKFEFKEEDLTWPERLKITEFNENDAWSKVKSETGLEKIPDFLDDKYGNGRDLDLWKIDDDSWRRAVNKYIIQERQALAIDNAKKNKLRRKVLKKSNLLALSLANLWTVCDNATKEVKHPLIFEDEVKQAISDTFDDLHFSFSIDDDSAKLLSTHTAELEKVEKKWRRKAIYKLLQLVKSKAGDLYTLDVTYDDSKDVINDSNWKSIVDGWKTKQLSPSSPTGLVDNVLSFSSNKFTNDWKNWWNNTQVDPWKDATSNHRRWKTSVEGKILFSDQANKTTSIDANGAIVTKANFVASDKYIEKLKNKIKNI
jgi:hypothetical protein